MVRCECNNHGHLPSPPLPRQRSRPEPVRGQALVTADGLLATVQRIRARVDAVRASMPQDECGVRVHDGLALLATAELAEVDVMLESGTAGGTSTELMARFFADRHVNITTVDLAVSSASPVCAPKVHKTHERLAAFPNIKAIVGDSFKVFPKLIQQHAGKRVGVFIDGPKGMKALDLCLDSIKRSRDVKFCAMHDLAAHGNMSSSSTQKAISRLKSLGRHVALTCCWDKWLQHFGQKPEDALSSIGVVAGLETVPLGAPGDDVKS